MKHLVAYSFSKEIAKKLGKAKFLQKHSKTFPNLNLEKVWNEMFPTKKKEDKRS